MERLGIRGLRADAAAAVRRAQAGQRTVITVSGRAVAQLGPLEHRHDRDLDELIAHGLVIAPRRGGDPSEATIAVWGNVRLDRLLREIRG